MPGKFVVSQIEKRRRGCFGMLIAVAFWVFNVVMALWIVGAWFSTTLESTPGMEGLEGVAVFVATGVLLWIWLFGAIILGIMMFATRGRKVIMNREPR